MENTSIKWTEESFKQLLKNSFDMIVLLDSNGVQKYVSDSCHKILGYQPYELTNIQVMDDMLHPDDIETVRKAFQDVLNNTAYGGVQYRHRHKNGTWVYLEAFGTNQISNPLIGSVVLNVRDISIRKETEDELRKSKERLRKLNATKDKFFSIIAHDLKSPFGSIIGFSNLLLEQLKEKKYDAVEEYATIIRDSSAQSMDLLTNLLKWSQSQTGKISFNPETIDLCKITQRLIHFFTPAAIQKSVKISHNIPSGFNIYADYELLNTVLRNLISNSIKFTDTDGEIFIDVKKTYDESIIRINDNGIGIKENAVDKIFRIDKQYTTRGTKNETGSGLGLLLCKEFVEMHGGEIWCTSKEGEGSTFSFSIPQQQK